jgi:hypothetical protein
VAANAGAEAARHADGARACQSVRSAGGDGVRARYGFAPMRFEIIAAEDMACNYGEPFATLPCRSWAKPCRMDGPDQSVSKFGVDILYRFFK